jgi:hypothetical protein
MLRMRHESFMAYFAAWCVVYAPMDAKDDVNAVSAARGIVFW